MSTSTQREKLVSMKMWRKIFFFWKSCSFHEKRNFSFNTIKDIFHRLESRTRCGMRFSRCFSRFSRLWECFSWVIFHMKMKIKKSKYTRKVYDERNMRCAQEFVARRKKNYIFVDISLKIILETAVYIFPSSFLLECGRCAKWWMNHYGIVSGLVSVGESLAKVTN